jgi:hypothetical protein
MNLQIMREIGNGMGNDNMKIINLFSNQLSALSFGL